MLKCSGGFPRRVFLWLLCFTLVAWQLSRLGVALGQVDPLFEAKHKWHEYLRSFPSVEGMQTETFSYFDGRVDVVNKRKFFCDYPNVCVYFESSDGDSGHIESNKKYAFSLDNVQESRLATIEECFLLKNIPPKNIWTFPANRRDVDRNSSVNLIAEVLVQGLILSHKWLPILVEAPDFILEGFDEDIQDGERVVRIKFTNNPKVLNDEAFLMNIRRGEVTLLPDNYWLIKDGECFFWSDRDDSYTNHWRNEYDFESFAVPVLVSRHVESVSENGQHILRREVIYEYKPFENASHKTFTLSDYGFPEPDFGDQRISTLRYFLVTIGGLLVAFALWRMYRNRKGHR